jgi:hypothetical protein
MALFSTFNATNKLRSKAAFFEKAKYEIGLFDEDDYRTDEELTLKDSIPLPEVDTTSPPKPIKKFFLGEYQYYGKVDETLSCIYPKKTKLQLISNKDNIFVLDFVAKKFADLKQNFIKCITIGSISKADPNLSAIKPFKGFSSVEEEYKNYINTVLDGFNQDYLVNSKKINNITNFNEYMSTLIEYSRLTSRSIPLSKTSFLKTNFCPLRVSGLVIEIAELKYSDDASKYAFTKSNNFKFFRNACIKHGFSIDYNAPWRIIADIDSPPMIEMMETMGYSRDTIFISHFDLASTLEVDNIKKVLYTGYSNLIKAKPNIYTVKEYKSRIKTKKIERKTFSIKNLNETVDSEEVIKIYIAIRANEQEKTLSEQKIQMLNKNAFSYLKTLGIQPAIDYIEQEMSKNQLTGSGTLNTIVINSKTTTRV